MQLTPFSKAFKQHVLERLDKIDSTIASMKADVKETKVEQAQAQMWQNATWNVFKWVSGISSALAVGAAIALVGLLIYL